MKEIKKGIKIVLIAVLAIIVLCIIFSLSLFSVPGVLGTSCTANQGFYCNGLNYSEHTGNLTVTIGQNTGQTWVGWAIGYAPNVTNATTGTPMIKFSAASSSPTLYSGQKAGIPSGILSVSKSGTTLGTFTFGSLWICYTKSKGVTKIIGGTGVCVPQGNSSAIMNYVEIATLEAKAS